MSFKIEIIADNGIDAAAQLLGFIQSLGTFTTPAMVVPPEVLNQPVVVETPPHVPAKAPRKSAAAKVEEAAAEAPAGESGTSTDGEKSDTKSETVSADTSTKKSADEPDAKATVAGIRELVLQVVDKRGRDKMEEILKQFGVDRATQVPEEQRDELAGLLADALSEEA